MELNKKLEEMMAIRDCQNRGEFSAASAPTSAIPVSNNNTDGTTRTK
jgi:hypothetical protein